MIAAEFDTLYGVNHAGGEVIHGFAFFGGTNGFWKFDLLDEIRMDTSMLTEDVDSAFRSLASGAHVVYDPMVVSYEEAPPSFQILIKQRLRWTQGWSEVAVRHIPLIWKKEFSIRRRFMICFLLHFRELYFYTSSLVLPTAIAFGLRKHELVINLPLLLVGVCPLLLPIIMTLVAHYQMPSIGHPELGPKQYVQYFFVSIPYELLKVMIAVLGHYRNLAGINKWEITTRIVPTKTADAENPVDDDGDDGDDGDGDGDGNGAVQVEAHQLIVESEDGLFEQNVVVNDSLSSNKLSRIDKLRQKKRDIENNVMASLPSSSSSSSSSSSESVSSSSSSSGMRRVV